MIEHSKASGPAYQLLQAAWLHSSGIFRYHSRQTDCVSASLEYARAHGNDDRILSRAISNQSSESVALSCHEHASNMYCVQKENHIRSDESFCVCAVMNGRTDNDDCDEWATEIYKTTYHSKRVCTAILPFPSFPLPSRRPSLPRSHGLTP